MAEFCTKCAENWGFPIADILVYRIFENLDKKDLIETDLCEGCGLVGILKDKDGYLQVARIKNGEIEWDYYDELV